MTEAAFRARLAVLGLKLDDAAFAAAWAGAQHLRAEISRVEKWLTAQQ